MDTSRFTKPEHGFALLDLTARFAFKTSSSISFDLGRMGNFHPEDEPDFVIHGFKVIGWLDVHHPCDASSIKAQVRICLPIAYHAFARMAAMLKSICEVLSIPPGDPCELKMFDSEQVTGIIPQVYLGMG